MSVSVTALVPTFSDATTIDVPSRRRVTLNVGDVFAAPADPDGEDGNGNPIPQPGGIQCWLEDYSANAFASWWLPPLLGIDRIWRTPLPPTKPGWVDPTTYRVFRISATWPDDF